MQKEKRRLVLAKEDYAIIVANLQGNLGKFTFNRQEAEELETGLKRAKLVSNKNFPADVVRLNSSVTVKDDNDGKIIRFTVVAPGGVDIIKRRYLYCRQSERQSLATEKEAL